MPKINETAGNEVHQQAHLRWINVIDTRVSPAAQRELRASWVTELAEGMDPDLLDHPTVSERDGHFWIIDGQHRFAAMKQMGWGDQKLQCWTYQGLTEPQEAELFLRLNTTLAVTAYPKYTIGITAGRAEELDIDRIVRLQGLAVTRTKSENGISCVGVLRSVYKRSGAEVLGRTLRIVRDAYGTPGYQSVVINGIAMLCARYNGQLKDDLAVIKLSKVHGGVNGLTGRAEKLRQQTGNAKAQCVAAAAVDIINANSTRGGKRLPSWWADVRKAETG